MRRYRLLLILGSAALLAELAYAILNLSALPVYVNYSLHEGQWWGFIFGTFLFVEAGSRPALGALSDRFGRKPFLIAGPAATAVTAYLTICVHGPFTVPMLIGLRVIDGLGSGALWPTAFATIGDIVDEENRSAAMSMLNVTYMSGLALGFLLGGAANDYFGTRTASFYLVSILLALSVVVLFVLWPRHLASHKHATDEMHGQALEIPVMEEPARSRLSDLTRSFRAVPDMVVLACVTFLGMGMLTPIVKLYALDHLGLSETQFGLLVAPVAAAMGVSAVPMGRLGDKYGKCMAVCWGLFASAIAMWVLALFRSIILAAGAGIIIGVGFTVAFPAWNALVLSVTSSDRRAEVLGAVGMAQGVAAGIGTFVGPLIYASDMLSFPRLGIVNYNVPFWISAILLSAGTVITFTWVRNRHGNKDPGAGVTDRQARLVVVASVVGLAVLCAWVGWRYARPIPPDRVAWAWTQQLVRGRADKAMRYVQRGGAAGWNGRARSAAAAKRFHYWREKKDAIYRVRFIESQSDGHAVVPIEFTLKGGRTITEHVTLCRQANREWKVCGLRETD